jgi:predicted alpha/beta superfamily hydrolase
MLIGLCPSFASPSDVALGHMTEATVRSTRQFSFRSAVNGERYDVKVGIPRSAPPSGGFPALLLLDGDAVFGSFAEAVRNRSTAGEIARAVVIGISGSEGEDGADRTLDFTSNDLSEGEKPLIKDLGPNPKFGGAEKFLQVIRKEIIPKVAAMATMNPRRTAIFGWSLGGLFVVHTMFTHPDAFKTYLALSPSLWRDDRAVFQEVRPFERAVSDARLKPSLFLGVGSREEEAVPGMLAGQMTHDELLAELRYGRMVGSVEELSRILEPFFNSSGLSVEVKIFAGETHNSVPWTAINPILDFALAQP